MNRTLVALSLALAAACGGRSTPPAPAGCGPGTTACGSACADLLSDTAHCGNCRVACDAGEACRYGVCSTVAPNPACGGLLLSGPPLTPSTAHPVAIGAARLDADAFTDVVIVEDSPTAGGRLLRFDGRGDGTFGAPVVVEPFTYTSPSALAMGYFAPPPAATTPPTFDAPDLVVASSAAGVTTLQPLLGVDGKGGFFAATGSALDAGSSPQTIVVADLNQDGWPDLVVGDGAAQASDNLRVFLNDGTGLFGLAPAVAGKPRTPNQSFTVPAEVLGLAAGSVGGKLAPDVVVTWAPVKLTPWNPSTGTGDQRCLTTDPCWLGGEVLVNDGNGALSRPTFNFLPTHQFLLQTSTSPALPLTPTAVATADLNHDGLADWAVAHAASSAVTFVLAAFADATHLQNGWAGTSWTIANVAEPRALLLREFEGDFYPDMVTVNAAAGAIYFHHNAGPTLAGVAFDPPVVLPVGDRPIGTALAPAATGGADFLFTADAASGDVAATQSLGNGAFQAARRLHAGVGTSGVALGNFDAGTSPDVALADVSSSRVALWLNPLTASGAPGTPVALPANSAPVSIVSTDLDADAHADLALALEGTAQVALLWGTGSGTFATPLYVTVGASPEQVLAADLNGDGRPDLVSADMGSNQLTVLFNQGARAFASPAKILPVGSGPRGVAALRLGTAACTSLVSANATAGTLTVHPCDAATPGSFLSPVTVPACAGARSLASADFDGDGLPDLAVACDAGIAVFRATASGALVGGVLFDSGGAPRSISVADLNGDGRPDILASVPGTGGVTVLQGAAALGFSPPRVYALGGEPLATVTANLYGHTDGRSDVCAAVTNGNRAVLGSGAALLQSGCLAP